ncbi:MAG: GGDEF domain-containing protein [Lachnotalea sp.]
MSVFLRIDINIVAIIVLATILVIAAKRLDRHDTLNKNYFKISLIVLLQLLFETTTCIINKREELWLIPISYLLHVCLYITGAILAYNGYVLVRQLVLPNLELVRKRSMLIKIPIMINTVLVLLSPRFYYIFYINKDNIYQRGNYFFISVVSIYIYTLLMLILIIVNRKKLVEHEFILLLIFATLPMVGGIIQSLFYGTLLMWSGTAFSLVIMYTYLQQRMVQLDWLTGVWSRGSFDFYIKNRFMQKNTERLGIIYCDIDGLKEINDQYGHLEGDLAIKTTTQLIRKALRKADIMVRMGGDEFVIVIECDSIDIMVNTLAIIESSFSEYNKTSEKNYKLSCSFGADVLSSNYSSVEEFLHHVDTLMYTNKKIKKGGTK